MDKKIFKTTRFISRNEKDNQKLVLDRIGLNYKLLNQEDYKTFLKGIKENQIEEIQNKVNDTPEGILTAPKKMYFDLTHKCNLRCKTCHNDSWEQKYNELTTEGAFRTVLGLKEDGVFNIKFSGGEITTKNEWDDIVGWAKELNMVVGINTNGMYSRMTLDKITKLELDDINVSIDGMRETNDYIRGKGSFDRAIFNIESLVEQDCNISINSVLTTRTTENDIRGLLELGEKHDIQVDFFHARPIGRARININLTPNYEQIAEFYETIRKYRPINNKNKPRKPITDGFEVFNIVPNGNIYAGGCVAYVSSECSMTQKLGNIVEENYSIGKIWSNSDKLNKIREKYENSNIRCISCNDYNKKCNGATAEMIVYNDVNNEKPFCKPKI